MFRGESDEEVIGQSHRSELVEGWTAYDNVINQGAVDYKELD
jgi:hypothetical protein